MSAPTVPAAVLPVVHYPDDDGEPMADNTVQYEWIVTVKGNLDLLFKDRPDVFVAGNNLIYPVEGKPTVRQAPDVYVAFGRPKGDRGSYRVWEEGGIFPQVVFEIRSPGNRAGKMARKLVFYEKYGAKEYYDYDPDRNRLRVHVCGPDRLEPVVETDGFVSPLMDIRFDVSGPGLVIYGPNGLPFSSFLELGERAERADRERDRADRERERADRLAARLRELGVDPDAA